MGIERQKLQQIIPRPCRGPPVCCPSGRGANLWPRRTTTWGRAGTSRSPCPKTNGPGNLWGKPRWPKSRDSDRWTAVGSRPPARWAANSAGNTCCRKPLWPAPNWARPSICRPTPIFWPIRRRDSGTVARARRSAPESSCTLRFYTPKLIFDNFYHFEFPALTYRKSKRWKLRHNWRRSTWWKWLLGHCELMLFLPVPFHIFQSNANLWVKRKCKYFRVDDGDGGQSALICWIFDDFGHSRLLVAGQSEILRRTEGDVVADWSGVVGQGQRQRIANCSTIWNFEFVFQMKLENYS